MKSNNMRLMAVVVATFLMLLMSSVRGQTTSGCDEAVGDGWCDFWNNNEDCNYDGGDCCACDCNDFADFECGIFGYNCVDPNSTCVSAPDEDDDEDDDSTPFGMFYDDDSDSGDGATQRDAADTTSSGSNVPVGAIAGGVIGGLLVVSGIILAVYLCKTGRLKADKCCVARDPAGTTAARNYRQPGARNYPQPIPADSSFPAPAFPPPSAPPAPAARSEMGSVQAGSHHLPVVVATSIPAAVAVAAPAPAPEPEHPSPPPPTYKTPAKHRAKAGASVDEMSPASGSLPPPNYKTPAKGWAQQATGNPDGESPASDGAPPPTYKTPAKGWA